MDLMYNDHVPIKIIMGLPGSGKSMIGVTMAEERMSCDYQGEEMLIGFNNTKMIDVLNNINSDTLVVTLSGPSRAGVFLPETQEDGEEKLVLLMPMMV